MMTETCRFSRRWISRAGSRSGIFRLKSWCFQMRFMAFFAMHPGCRPMKPRRTSCHARWESAENSVNDSRAVCRAYAGPRKDQYAANWIAPRCDSHPRYWRSLRDWRLRHCRILEGVERWAAEWHFADLTSLRRATRAEQCLFGAVWRHARANGYILLSHTPQTIQIRPRRSAATRYRNSYRSPFSESQGTNRPT